MSRVVLVTGGVRGIGAAICKGLKTKGYKVAATYAHNQEAADQFARDTGIHVYKWDVSNYQECVAGVQQVVEDIGAIEILVNNAGITRDSMFHKMTPEDWNAVINTNLNSVFNMTSQVIGRMREREFGRIVNIASINGQKGQAGQTNYSASKAAMIGFTKALALENANKNITVNAVAPGYIATEMVQQVPREILDKIIALIPAARLGSAEEVARCVAFLISDEAGFVTGSTLSLNGGQYMV